MVLKFARKFSRMAVLPCVLAILASQTYAAVHSLSESFDDINNPSPSGWSYLNGGETLRNFVFNWNEPDFGPGQGGWEGPSGQPHAGWSKITEDNASFSGFDVAENHVVTHGNTQVSFAPAAAGAPASGSFTVTGGVNNIRQLGRAGTWQLLLNNMVISQGNNGDEFTSDAPSLFSEGCGGVNGITSINYNAGDVISLKVLQNDFVHVDMNIETSATLGQPAATCAPIVVDKPHVAYYRFEEADGDDIIDSLTGEVHGTFVNGGARTNDVPFVTVPQTGQANLRAADFTEAGHALIEGTQFVMHGPNAGGANGDATVEWFMKVPNDEVVPNGHTAILWTSDTGADAERFNIFWDASFTQSENSDRFVAADYRAPDTAGPFVVGTYDNGNPLTEDAWHHIAIVRTDNTPDDNSDSSFTWNWYLDGQLSDGHTSTTTDPTPVAESWLIAGRQGNDAVRAYIDEVRMTAAALSPSQFLNAVGGGMKGDFDGDGTLDVDDINQLSAAVRTGANVAKFDLNNDAKLDAVDRKIWVNDLKKTYFGDANLDGEFSSGDFVKAFTVGKYENGADALWDEGDWDGNGKFESGDFVAAFTEGGYELGPRQSVAAVPEPGSLAWMSALALLSGLRRKRV